MESEKPDKDLIVDVSSTEVHIALMENHRLIEYNTESSTGNKFTVGDVHLGKVKKLLPNLNAAFVDIGDKKEAFIHYLDLGLFFPAFDQFVREALPKTDLKDLYSKIDTGTPLPKEGKIEDYLKPGQMVVVQIVKEPISTKGSRLTAEISLAGRNIVLLPFAEKVSVSQRIASKEERRRLESLVRSILPVNYGAIIRTAAEGKNAAVLVGELKASIEKWENSWKKLASSKGIQMLFTEYSKTTTILRDLLNDSFSNVYVNDEKIYEETRKYISLISPDQEKIVKYYDGKEPIFDHFEVSRQIKSSFGKVVTIKQGAYLVIESTEALHVIDVNSGIRAKTEDQEEKRRLETLVKSILPKNYGAIIRTAAEGKTASTLIAETQSLIEKWESSWNKIAKNKGVQLLFTEYSKTTTVLRDLLNDSFSNIWINDEKVCDEARKYISLISPEQEKIVHLYEGRQPIYDHFEVTRQIKGSFGKVVPMRQGAYLVIETTEALNVIDVNSGTRTKTHDQEENSFEVNKIAAEEIARQLRLRDMGGIIIVDFIDMESVDHRNALHKLMQDLMEEDRAKHNVLPLTKFGLMQITRQRIRPVTEINTEEQCPLCHGTGKIHSSVVIDEEIERKLAFYVIEKGVRSVTIKTSPILGAYLKRGFFNSFVTKWKKRYKVRLEVVEVTDFSVLQHEMYNEKGEKLE